MDRTLNTIRSISSTLLMLILLVAVVGVLAYCGVGIAAYLDRPGQSMEPPTIGKAAWEVEIKNTGTKFYTKEEPLKEGTIYTLDGYYMYDLRKEKYIYFDEIWQPDESLFGPILIKRR